jgi:hypothetical protein
MEKIGSALLRKSSQNGGEDLAGMLYRNSRMSFGKWASKDDCERKGCINRSASSRSNSLLPMLRPRWWSA